ncbi:MAG: hypothetical protein IPO22_07295 [Anaerolineales bacterium]|nr:hypothetical protein [Anaerolineales bacterium]
MKRISPLLVILGILFAVTACIPDIVGGNPSGSSEPAPTPMPVEKILSSFNPIQGTNYLMAGVISAPITRDSSFNPLEWINNSARYSSYSSDTHNYVFFNLNTEEYKRLLPTNDYSIFQTSGFPTLQYDPANPDQPAPTVEWWVYSVIKKDTNNDGYFGDRDKLSIAISDVGGNGYAELIENADAILSQIYKDNSALFIIYNADKKNFIAKINLSTREVISTTEMDLGEDVK